MLFENYYGEDVIKSLCRRVLSGCSPAGSARHMRVSHTAWPSLNKSRPSPLKAIAMRYGCEKMRQTLVTSRNDQNGCPNPISVIRLPPPALDPESVQSKYTSWPTCLPRPRSPRAPLSPAAWPTDSQWPSGPVGQYDLFISWDSRFLGCPVCSTILSTTR